MIKKLSIATVILVLAATILALRRQSLPSFSYTYEERHGGVLVARGERKVKANAEWMDRREYVQTGITGTLIATIATGVVSVRSDRLVMQSPFHGLVHVSKESDLRNNPDYFADGNTLGYRTIILKVCDHVGCSYLHFAPQLQSAMLEAHYAEGIDIVATSVTIGNQDFSVPNLPVDRTTYDSQLSR